MGFKIDGIATNGALDSSGEIMNVEGHDISDLEEGRGVVNWEHNNDSSEDVIGAIVYAKKIYKPSDCENARQKKFLELSGGPYVYVIAELFDDEQHPGAIAAAALVRYYHKRKIKILAGFSIEGHTLARQGNNLERSVGRRVALTLRPCNKACVTDVLEDPLISGIYEKTTEKSESKIPSYEVENIIIEDPLVELLEGVLSLQKTLVAGNYDVAPSARTGGTALQVEAGVQNRLKAALRDWNRARPLKAVIKAALPEISDDYVDHFVGVAEDMMLKKGLPLPVRIGSEHSAYPDADDVQLGLVNGLHLDDQHLNSAQKHIVQNDEGSDVSVKTPRRNKANLDSGLAASAYYRAARDAFGLGDFVPATNSFKNGKMTDHGEGLTYIASEKRRGLKTPYSPDVDMGKVLTDNEKTGDLYKLGFLDYILGYHDRHLGNIMLDARGRIIHVDNDHAFVYPDGKDPLMESAVYNKPVPPEIERWLQGIDPKVLIHRLDRAGLDPERIKRAILQLRLAQKRAQAGYTFGSIIGIIKRGT